MRQPIEKTLEEYACWVEYREFKLTEEMRLLNKLLLIAIKEKDKR